MGKIKSARGFTLVECMISMVIVVTGFAAVYSLMAVCVRTEVISREMSRATSQARMKMEELKFTTRTPGGSLTANTANYFDNPHPRYTRRWQVSTDRMGLHTVTVLMLPDGNGTVLPEVRLITRMK